MEFSLLVLRPFISNSAHSLSYSLLFPFFYLTLSLCALTTPCHFFLSFVLSLWSVTVCLTYFNLASLFLICWFLLNLGLKFLHPYIGTCMYNSCPHLDAWSAGEDRFSSTWALTHRLPHRPILDLLNKSAVLPNQAPVMDILSKLEAPPGQSPLRISAAAWSCGPPPSQVAAEVEIPSCLSCWSKKSTAWLTLLWHFGEKFLAYGVAAGSKSVHRRLQLEPEIKVR